MQPLAARRKRRLKTAVRRHTACADHQHTLPNLHWPATRQGDMQRSETIKVQHNQFDNRAREDQVQSLATNSIPHRHLLTLHVHHDRYPTCCKRRFRLMSTTIVMGAGPPGTSSPRSRDATVVVGIPCTNHLWVVCSAAPVQLEICQWPLAKVRAHAFNLSPPPHTLAYMHTALTLAQAASLRRPLPLRSTGSTPPWQPQAHMDAEHRLERQTALTSTYVWETMPRD